jgi:hypothetical protein
VYISQVKLIYGQHRRIFFDKYNAVHIFDLDVCALPENAEMFYVTVYKENN